MKLLNPTLIAMFLSFCLIACGTHASGDAEKGKARSGTCVACHGSKGISMVPMYPNLAGQKEQYLNDSLKAYRDGTRKNMVMSPQAMNLSDEDIANLAAYYASLDPTGK